MAIYSEQCSSVGGFGYANNFRLYVELNETDIDIGNNTSKVQYNVYCQASGKGSIDANHYMYFAINYGEKLNQTTKVTVSSPNAYIYVTSGTTDAIGHNEDGTLTIPFYAEIRGITFGVRAIVSGNFTLSTIPRKSPISASDGLIEGTSTINITSASSGFKHSVALSWQGIETQILNNVAGGIHIYTIPSSFYEKIPDQPSATGTLYCNTYNSNGQFIGQTTTSIKISADYERCKPDIDGTLIDVNPITLDLTGDENSFIKGFSTAKVTINAEPKNNATIKTYRIDNVEIEGNSKEFPNNIALQYIIEAIDSRGFSNTKTIYPLEGTIAYIPLSVSATFFRPQPTTGEVDITYSGNYYDGNFGAKTNDLLITWKYKEKGQDDWITGGQLSPTIDENVIVATTTNLGRIFDYQKSYTFRLSAVDKLSNISVEIDVSKGIPVFWWGEDFFNVEADFTVKGLDITNEYSLQEKPIGIWIDGKTIYRKTLPITLIANTNRTEVYHGISNLDNVISYKGFMRYTASGFDERRFLPQFYYTMEEQYACTVYAITDTTILMTYGKWAKEIVDNLRVYVTLEYTKK